MGFRQFRVRGSPTSRGEAMPRPYPATPRVAPTLAHMELLAGPRRGEACLALIRRRPASPTISEAMPRSQPSVFGMRVRGRCARTIQSPGMRRDRVLGSMLMPQRGIGLIERSSRGVASPLLVDCYKRFLTRIADADNLIEPADLEDFLDRCLQRTEDESRISLL